MVLRENSTYAEFRLLALSLLCCLVSWFQFPILSNIAEAQSADPLSYSVVFQAADSALADFEANLREISLSVTLIDEPPKTQPGLKRRAEQDVERIFKLLRSRGHYDASVSFRILTDADLNTTHRVVFEFDPGPIYLIEEVLVVEDDRAPVPASEEVLKQLGLDLGAPATAQSIISAQTALERFFRRAGRPIAKVEKRTTKIVPERHSMRVTYKVQRGPTATFGMTVYEGLEGVEEKYLGRQVPWQFGDTYDARLIEEFQRKLVQSGLFESVLVAPVTDGIADAESDLEPVPVNVRVTVQERPHRSLGFGASYSTSIGPAARAFWEHRNIFGQAERFRGALVLSPVERGVDLTYRKPFFLREDQAFLAQGDFKDVTSDAFDERHAEAFAGVERRLSDTWTATVGPTVDLISQESESVRESEVVLLGFRGNLNWDSTDNLLNPTRGGRIDLALSPYKVAISSGDPFLSTAVVGSTYLQIDNDGDFILAGRTKLGAIIGAELVNVPAGKRFYAGGGGSVRGYGFQRLGPLDGSLDPTGGRSVLELGAEMRFKVTEDFGIVPFMEAGNVYVEDIPPLGESDLRWGAGIGVRYFTEFGPIRFDVAVPIDQRENIDDPFQLYISLGQAF